MNPATADQALMGRMGLAPDVCLVTAPDGQRSGLQRGLRVIWLPPGLGEAVWRKGPQRLPAALQDLLAAEGMLAERGAPLAGEDRNDVFTRALCGAGADAVGFHEASFVLAGCGGLGSQIAIQLAALGARRFHLIDGDVIEKSNLNRLVFAADEDCGKLKTDVLARHLAQRFGAKVSASPCFVSAAESCLSSFRNLSNPFLILSADEASALREFLAALYKRGGVPPYLHAGYVGAHCVAGPLVRSGGEPCPFCGSGATITRRDGFVAPSALANNALIAGFAVSQILLALATGNTALAGRRWLFDLPTGQSRLIPLLKQSTCEVCDADAGCRRA